MLTADEIGAIAFSIILIATVAFVGYAIVVPLFGLG